MTSPRSIATEASRSCREASRSFDPRDLQLDLGDASRGWWIALYTHHSEALAGRIRTLLMQAEFDDYGCLVTGSDRAQTSLNGRREYIYRLIAFGITATVPTKRHVVRHLCHNPRCIHPEHLRIGTYAQNKRDERWVRAGRYGGLSDEDFALNTPEREPRTYQPLPLEQRRALPKPKAKPWRSNKPK